MIKKKTSTATVNWDHTGVKTVADIGGYQVVYGSGNPNKGDGPTPVGMLLSSLGACLTQIIASMAAKRRIEITDIQVRVEGDMDLEGIINRASGIRTGVQEIRYHVTVDSPAPREEILKLIEQAELLCPVKDTLQLGSLLINTSDL